MLSAICFLTETVHEVSLVLKSHMFSNLKFDMSLIRKMNEHDFLKKKKRTLFCNRILISFQHMSHTDPGIL